MQSASPSLPGAAAPAGAVKRRELFLWVIVCLLINQAFHRIDTTSFTAFTTSLATQNLIYWFACFVVIRRLIDSDDDAKAGAVDIGLATLGAAAIIASSFVPYRFCIAVLTTIAGLYLMNHRYGDRCVTAAGIVFLAITVQIAWAPLFFRFFSPHILWADAATLQSVLTLIGSDVERLGSTTFQNSEGHTVSLVGACSAFANISIGALAFVSTTMMVRTYWIRSDIVWVLVIIAIMILTNAVRLSIFDGSIEAHRYWHDGEGAQYLALAQTAIVAMLCFLSTLRTEPSR